MCSHYEAPGRQQLLDIFGLEPQAEYKLDLFPGSTGVMIRNLARLNDEGELEAEAVAGVFGLLPFWAKDEKLARRTYNARSETVAELPSFRSAWKQSRHCIIPAAAIYEPDWRSGKARPARIWRKDGKPLGIAGIWESWRNPEGAEVLSYSMLTINADDHELLRNYHKSDSEKRMVVILPAGAYRDWLKATPAESLDFLRQYPADRLQAETLER